MGGCEAFALATALVSKDSAPIAAGPSDASSAARVHLGVASACLYGNHARRSGTCHARAVGSALEAPCFNQAEGRSQHG